MDINIRHIHENQHDTPYLSYWQGELRYTVPIVNIFAILDIILYISIVHDSWRDDSKPDKRRIIAILARN